MKQRSGVPARIAKDGYIVLSAAFLLLGILFITVPQMTEKIFGILIGVSMMVFGAVKLVGYFSKDLYRLAFQYDLQFGILTFVMGLVTVINYNETLKYLSIALAVCFLADNIFKVQVSIEAKKFGVKPWWAIFAATIISGAAALVLIFRPSEAEQAVRIFLGISFLCEAVLTLLVSLFTVKVARERIPDEDKDEDVI